MPFIVLFLRNGNKIERAICFVSLPFILNAFILCNSRGAVVALAIALFVSAFLIGDKRARRGMYAITLVAAPVFLFLTDSAFTERIATLFGAKEAYQTEEEFDRLSSGRVAIWNYGMEMAADHPMGVGPDGAPHAPRYPYDARREGTQPRHAVRGELRVPHWAQATQ